MRDPKTLPQALSGVDCSMCSPEGHELCGCNRVCSAHRAQLQAEWEAQQ